MQRKSLGTFTIQTHSSASMARFRIAAAALTVFGATVATGLMSSVRAQGSLFTTTEVDETKFVLVSAPIGSGERSQLNIYEQRTSARPCYSVTGSAPAVVDPLLATFDFTGICNRYIDGNGYSLRIGGNDLGTRYRLSVIKSANDVQLMAVPTRNPSEPTFLVARAGGFGNNKGFGLSGHCSILMLCCGRRRCRRRRDG